LLNSQRNYEIIENRKHIYFLLKSTLFFAKLGLIFRGIYETKNSNNRGNFIEFVKIFIDGN